MRRKRSFFIGYRRRILLSIAFLVVLITLSLTIYGAITTRQIFKTHFDQTGNYLAKNLSANSQLGVFAEDELFLAPALAAIVQNEDAIWACAYNHKGEEIACITRKDIAIPVVPETVKNSVQHIHRTEILQNKIAVGQEFDVIDFYSPIYISAQPEFEPFYGDFDKIYEENRLVGFARVGISLEILSRKTKELMATSALLFCSALFLGLLAILYIEKKITAPVRDIARGASKIAEGELDTRIPVNSEDELGELAAEFNNMSAKLKQYQSEIVKRGDFLENLLECANIIIVETDNEYKITRFNSFAEETFKHLKEEALGRDAISLLICPEDQEKTKKVFQQQHITGGYQCACLTKESKKIMVSWINSIILDEKETKTGLLLIGTDISEKIKIEQRLLHSEKLKSLGEMAGGVAHDFNNLLATIVGRVQLIKMKAENARPGEWEKLKQHMLSSLDIIEKASHDGAETVKRIQTFSLVRKDGGEFEPVFIEEQINSAIEFTRTKWKNAMEAEGKKINIITDFSNHSLVSGNAAELREIFTNLINNSLDAMPQGGNIFFKTRSDNTHVLIEIQDEGSGIPDEIIERVFDPFYSTKGVQSSGLGLSICHGIISSHGGSIKVKSRCGAGTLFLIKFPLLSRKNFRKEKLVFPAAKHDFKNAILVIEDDKDVRGLLCDMISEEGHFVEAACNGSEGIKKFSESGFDFVFTDLGMADISGWEVIKKIKQIKPSTPVALITGWGAQIDEEQKKLKLADEIINKPFSVETIRKLIEKFNLMIAKDNNTCS